MNPTDQQKLLDDLLTKWEDRVARGENPTAEELCADYPELFGEVQRHIKALQSFASRFGIEANEDSASWHDDKTADLPVRVIRIEAEYHLERLHGVGGLGSVYLAHDPQLNRRVAIKFPRGQRHSAVSRLRFEREARITSRLDHPGIVPVHVIHTDTKGQPCYAMRFIEGDTLQVAIDRFHKDTSADRYRGAEFRNLLRRFQVVCEIAAYAHSQGIIHRDIKPSNIMLGPFGETLLVDWGLAKIMKQADDVPALATLDDVPSASGSVTATQSGQIIGTSAFASPEQLMAQTEQVNSRSDVFSLGATLFSLLTGEHLLQSHELPEHLKRIQRNQILRPCERNAAVPIALDAICSKALSVNPEARYDSPQELSRDIERFLSDDPVSVPCETLWTRSARWLRKHPVRVVAALTACFIGLVVTLISSIVLNGKNQELDRANKEQNYAYMELSKAWGAKNLTQMELEESQVTSSQVIKYLNSLSDLNTSIFPDHIQLITDTDLPFLDHLLQRYLGYASYSGYNPEFRYIRAIGTWRAGGLLLAMGRLPEAEVQLLAAHRDLLLLQEISQLPAMDQCSAQCCLMLAQCQLESGNSELAIENYRQALAQLDKLILQGRNGLVEPDIDIHRAEAICVLLEQKPNPREMTELLVALADAKSQLETELARPGDTLPILLKLVRILRVQANVGMQDTPERSRDLLEQATTICERLLRDHPTHRRIRWDLAHTCSQLTQVFSLQKDADPDRALLAASRTVALLQSLYSEFPAEAKIRSALAAALNLRAQLQQPLGQENLVAEDRRFAEALAASKATSPISLPNDQRGSQPFVTLPDTQTLPDTATTLPAQTPAQTAHADISRKRKDLINSLSVLRDQHIRDGRLDLAMVAFEREQRLRRDARASFDVELPIAELEIGLSPHHRIIDHGDVTFVEVPGNEFGKIWGSGPYTDDSDLGAAAVHSGHLQPGEFKFVAIRRRQKTGDYAGSEVHGIKSLDCPFSIGGFDIIASAVRLSVFNHDVVYKPEIKSVNVLVQGDVTGAVTGTDLYSVDSDLRTAAVHQGLLKPGEYGIIRVDLLPVLDSYTPSTRNGVTSGTINTWPGTMRLTKIELE